MTLNVVASGTQTATVGTTHTLATLAGPKTYTLHVDCSGMAYASGTADEVELVIATAVKSGGTERTTYSAVFVGAQDLAMKVSIPVPVPYTATVTLRQSAGTGRSYDWAITTPD